MAGSAAAIGTAGAAGVALAGTVQITQIDNFASMSSGAPPVDSLKKDLTGDGVNDLVNLGYRTRSTVRSTGLMTGTYAISHYLRVVSFTGPGSGASTAVNLGFAGEIYRSVLGSYYSTSYRATAGSGGDTGSTFQDVLGHITVSFRDSRINGGITSNALLEVRSRNTGRTDHRIDLVRLIFDDSSTAAPIGILPGDPDFPEFVAPADTTAQKAKLKKQIKKLTKKQKAAKKRGKKALAKRLSKKIKKLKAALRKL